jgi:hypothetical protein
MHAATTSDLVRDFLLSLQDNPAIRALGLMPIGGSNAAIVYHGTGAPKFSKFDLSKIGTGEGVQAYGYGHYLAGNPKVAKDYFDRFKSFDPLEITFPSGKKLHDVAAAARQRFRVRNPYTLGSSAKVNALNELDYQLTNFSHLTDNNALPSLVRLANDNNGTRARNYLSTLIKHNVLKLQPTKVRGGIVKAEIPDEAIDKMLDWHNSISRQPKTIKDYLASNRYVGEPVNRATEAGVTVRGSDIYRLGSQTYLPKALSSDMQAAGIPGIKYLDGTSRDMNYSNVRPENFNYVSFSDELPKILDYYDWNRLRELGIR